MESKLGNCIYNIVILQVTLYCIIRLFIWWGRRIYLLTLIKAPVRARSAHVVARGSSFVHKKQTTGSLALVILNNDRPEISVSSGCCLLNFG